jgi:hypothetical protein
MQTFMPYGSDLPANAAALDRQRLGKQRVEAWQILRVLNGTRQGWQRHPAVLMWKNYERGLAAYGLAMCDEWIWRGYQDTMRERFLAYAPDLASMPSWANDVDLITSHRSNLIRKMPEHYKHMWPDVPDTIAYVWPVGGHHRERSA